MYSKEWHAFCDAIRDFRREQDKLIQAQKLCVNCKAKPARPDSLYCSDRCKRAFLYFPEAK